MTVFEIYDFLNEKFDFSTKMDWDNVGLLVGNGRDTVKGILVCLDLTEQSLADAVKQGANLIITHHPVVFDGLKTVTTDGLIYPAARNGISIISAHTNLDAADGGINDYLARLVGLTNIERAPDKPGIFYSVGRVGEFEEPISADELAEKLSKVLKTNITYVGENKFIKKLAVCSGGGGGLYTEALSTGADAYLSGDFKYDHFMAAYPIGFALFDAGHFPTEDIIITPVANLLRENFPDIPVFETHFTPIKHKTI